MSGLENSVTEFTEQILCGNALEWSDDNRIAVSTEKGIVILDPQYSPHQLEKNFLFYQSYIPSPTTPHNLTGYSLQQFKELSSNFNRIQEEEQHELFLDFTLNPYMKSSVSNYAYKSPKWSPLDADQLGRCVLATLTADHRLIIYSSTDTHRSWSKVVDISEIYSQQFREEFTSDMTFQKYKSICFQMSAVDIAWSSRFHCGNSKYSLLAVAMKNGDVIVWKMNLPLREQSDCQLLKKIDCLSSEPSVIRWSEQTDSDMQGYLLLGYHDGRVFILTVNLLTAEVKSTVQLHKEEDSMQVTCLGSYRIPQNRQLVLATKEFYVMAWMIERKDNSVTVVHSTYETGSHSYYATGLTMKDDYFVMSSIDAYIQRIHTHIEDNEIRLKFSTIDLNIANDRKCLGVGISKHGVFLVTAIWPLGFIDSKAKKWKPLKIISLPIEDKEYLHKKLETYLLDETVPCHEIPDILELFRQYLWTGFNPIPTMTKYISESNKWYTLPIKFLRLLRYFLFTIRLHIPSSKDDNNERILTDSKIKKLSEIICVKEFETYCDRVLRLNESLTSKEKDILRCMLNWMQVHEEWFKETSLETKICELNKILGNTTHQLTCCVCNENLMFDDFKYKCSNGHIFGMCCKSSLPCTLMYRTCTTCKAQALPSDFTDDIRWITEQNCNLCGGLLLCKNLLYT